MTYMRSLRETREMPIEVVLPGHGEPVTDHAKLIDERFALHERRAAKIGGLIAERPLTAYEIAQSLWGNVAVTQAFLTLSEVLGHVDLLIDRGEVRETRGRRRDPVRSGLMDEIDIVLVSLLAVGRRARHGRAADQHPVPDRAGDRRPGARRSCSGRTTR